MARETSAFMSMRGGGYYSRATIGAKHVIDGAAALVHGAISRMDPVDDGPIFTVADMGCADGGTSINLIGRILRDLRARMPSRPIQMVYTDLPRNDFSQLFRIIHGHTDVETYVNDIDNLFVLASATSFHNRLFPAGTLHLGISATASHYLSANPGIISDHVHMVGATGAERDAFVRQGRSDWERILLARAVDLAGDGRLALFNFGIDEAGRYLGATGGINMFDTFNVIWSRLRDEGRITPDEYRNTNFPQHYRTVEEFVAPFHDETGPVYQAGLRLEHVETRLVRCPYAVDFASHGNAARFAHEYIPTLRSWSEATFAGGLSPSRPAEQRRSIIDRLYSDYEQMVREAPDGHGMDYVHCHLIIRKIAS